MATLDDTKSGAFGKNAIHPPAAAQAAAWDGLPLKALFNRTVEDYFRYNDTLAALLFGNEHRQARPYLEDGNLHLKQPSRVTVVRSYMTLSDELFTASYLQEGQMTALAMSALVKQVIQEVAFAFVSDYANLLLPKTLPDDIYYTPGVAVCGRDAYRHIRITEDKHESRRGYPRGDRLPALVVDSMPSNRVVWLPEVLDNARHAFEAADVFHSLPSPTTRQKILQVQLLNVPVLTYVEGGELYEV